MGRKFYQVPVVVLSTVALAFVGSLPVYYLGLLVLGLLSHFGPIAEPSTLRDGLLPVSMAVFICWIIYLPLFLISSTAIARHASLVARSRFLVRLFALAGAALLAIMYA